MQIWVYIVECSDGSYYTGTHRGSDPVDRESEHNEGKYPDAWTYKRRPVKLVFAEEFEDPLEAIAFERQVKGWSRAKKLALIERRWRDLKPLARGYDLRRDDAKKEEGG